MKAVSRFIAAHNLLPIICSFICYIYFSTLNHQETDYFFAFGASFFCWLFYWSDKIKDNQKQLFEPSERHYLSDTDKKIQWFTGLLLAILTLINFHTVPMKQMLIFSAAIPVCMLYLLVANYRKNFVKEIFSSLIISLTLCLFPILLTGETGNLSLFPVFFLMVFGNLLLLGILERDYDLRHNFNSLSVHLKESTSKIIFFLLLLTLLLLTFMLPIFNIIWVYFYCIFYTVLFISRKKIPSDLLHLLTDVVFLFPLLSYYSSASSG